MQIRTKNPINLTFKKIESIGLKAQKKTHKINIFFQGMIIEWEFHNYKNPLIENVVILFVFFLGLWANILYF